jgi:hypothetical protein
MSKIIVVLSLCQGYYSMRAGDAAQAQRIAEDPVGDTVPQSGKCQLLILAFFSAPDFLISDSDMSIVCNMLSFSMIRDAN